MRYLTDEQIEARIDELETLLDESVELSDEWLTLCNEQANLEDEQSRRHRADPDYIKHELGRIPDSFID